MQDLRLEIGTRSILRVALPLMLSSLFHHFIGLIDTIFMGQIGELQLAACGVAALFYFVLAMVPFALSIGTQILIARRAGEGNYLAIGRLFDNGLYILAVPALLLFLFVQFGARDLLGLLFSSDEVLAEGMRYLNIRAWELFPSAIGFGLSAFFTGIGRTRVILYGTLITLASNVFFNYGLVFGEFGFPRMEIAGAALASLISTTIYNIVLVVFVFRRGQAATFHLFRLTKPAWGIIRSTFNLSGPIVLQHMVGMTAWFTFFTLIEHMGSAELAVSNVIKEVYMLFGITTWGLGNATNTLVSNLLGQERPDELRKLVLKVLALSLSCAILLASVIWLIPGLLLDIFTNDPDLIRLGIAPLRVAGGALVLMSISVMFFRTTSGIGATRFALLAEVLSVCCYLLYVFSLVGTGRVGLPLAWMAEYLYWTVMGSACLIYLLSGRWRRVSL